MERLCILMFLGLLFSLLTGIFWTFIGVIFSKVAEKGEDAIVFTTITAFFSLLFSMFFMVKWRGLLASKTVPNFKELLILMCIAGALNMLASLLMVICMKKGHNGIIWAIGQSAMAVPFLSSIIIWQNKVNIKGWLGIAFILSMIILFGYYQKSEETYHKGNSWLLISLFIFLIYGVQQTINTVPSRWSGWEDTYNLRVPLSMIGGFIFQVIIMLFTRIKLTLKSLSYGILAAILITLGEWSIFLSMDLLKNSGLLPIVYPLSIGISIIGVTLYSGVVLKEKFKLGQLIGIFMGITGIIFISMQ